MVLRGSAESRWEIGRIHLRCFPETRDSSRRKFFTISVSAYHTCCRLPGGPVMDDLMPEYYPTTGGLDYLGTLIVVRRTMGGNTHDR